MKVNITPDHDSYVNSNPDYKNTNYGSEATLNCRQWGERTKRPLIKWSKSLIESNIPNGASIISATFYLYISSTAKSLTRPTHKITSDWDESTVTWNNQPSYDTDTNLGDIDWSSTGWKTVDITDLFAKWHKGTTGAYGIVVYATGYPDINDADAKANSSENASNKPYVEVEYKVGAGILAWWFCKDSWEKHDKLWKPKILKPEFEI